MPKEKKISDLLVLDKMAEANGDIALSTTIYSMERNKKGCYVTMQIDEATFNKLKDADPSGNSKYIPAFYCVNKKDFNEIKKSGK